MNAPLVLAVFIELLREDVGCVRIMRLAVSRVRMRTVLQELLSLVRPTADIDAAAQKLLLALINLFDALGANDLPGLPENDVISAARQDALRAVAALERLLLFVTPSDTALELGLDWRAQQDDRV